MLEDSYFYESPSQYKPFTILGLKPISTQFIDLSYEEIYTKEKLLAPLTAIKSSITNIKSCPLSTIQEENHITNLHKIFILYNGIPKGIRGLRSLLWKTLLDYYPEDDVSSWQETMIKSKTEYEKLKSQYRYNIINDKELIKQIELDLPRTQSNEPFFISKPKGKKEKTHYEIIKRILYIYAKVNPKMKYTQGMNEICAVIYFALWKDTEDDFLSLHEGEVFFTFSSFMSKIEEIFTLNNSILSTGKIQKRTDLIRDIMKFCDPELDSYITSKVDYFILTYRWIFLLFSQDLDINSLILFWDRLFAVDDIISYVCYFSASILIINRKELMQMDDEYMMHFTSMIKNIAIKDSNFISIIIKKANELKEMFEMNNNEL